MNNAKPPLEHAIIEADKENEDLYKKELELRRARVDRQYQDLSERKRQEEKAKQIDVSVLDKERLEKLQKENEEYLTKARKSQVFLRNEAFKGKIPYFPRNIILATAETGDGKSTACANLSYYGLCQSQRVLVITNEENVSDVYNRVTALSKGWSYSDHTQISNEQIKEYNKMMGILSERMTVIDDSYMGEMNQTTSIEGIESIFTSLLKPGAKKYDLIIIDYYQNIDKSLKAPELDGWKTQERFVKFIDSFKNRYDAPIVVLAQKRPNSENVSFKESIEGRKVILNVATCALDIKANRELLRTEWTIKKSRFTSAVGETIYTGYKDGMYVDYTNEFKQRVDDLRQRQKMAKALGKVMANKDEGNK